MVYVYASTVSFRALTLPCDSLTYASLNSRVWTFQEPILARENICLCGDSKIALIDITRVATWLRYNAKFLDKLLGYSASNSVVLNDAIDQAYRFGAPQESWHARTFPTATRKRRCHMPVDRIYAGLGVVNPLQIVPDYRKTARAVYEDFAKSTIELYEDLAIFRDVLDETQRVDEQLAGLASWSPNWCQTWAATQHPKELSRLFHASDGKSCDVKFELDQDGSTILQARGVELGSIHQSFQVFEGSFAKGWDLHWQRALDMVKEQIGNVNKLKEQDLNLVTARVLVAENVVDRGRASWESLAEDFEAYIDCVQKRLVLPLQKAITNETPGVVRQARNFFDQVDSAARNRLAFSTTNKHFGLGPRTTKAGDVAVILYGLEWPAILRPVGNQFTFLGLAYVYGAMDGEALQGDEVDEKVFHIR